MLYFILVILIMAAVEGNVIFIIGLWNDDMLFITENMVLVFLGGVADFIFLCYALKKVIPPLRNQAFAKKASANLTKSLENVNLDIERLEELRKQGINENSARRTIHFCRLMESIAAEGQLKDCLAKAYERQSVLEQIYDIENRLLNIAESYKDAGDAEKCLYYLGFIQSKKVKAKITSLEDECRDMRLWHYEERRVIDLWKKVFLVALAAVIMITVVLCIRYTFYIP